MATFTPLRLGQTQPSTGYAAIYTVPALTSCIVKEIVVCNVTAAPVVLDVSLVPFGGTAGVLNNVIAQHSIGAYSTVSYTFAQVLGAGAFISARAGVSASLTLTVSGVEFL